ncbi:MAG: hypothetical protein HYX53_00475 [Chloroflexi bacterium]|nr:hypothetical protein [Chloroflexota bacterium]
MTVISMCTRRARGAAALAVLVAMGAILSGCGNKDDSTGGTSTASTSNSTSVASGTKTPGPTIVVAKSTATTRPSAYKAVTIAQFKGDDVTKPTLPVKDGSRIESLKALNFADDEKYPGVALTLQADSDIVAPFDGKIALRVTFSDTGKVAAGSFSYVITNVKGEAVELWLPATSILLLDPGANVKRGQTIAKYSSGTLGKQADQYSMLMFFSRSTTDTPIPITADVWATGSPVVYIG